jgi:hypothetical protein
MRDPGREHPKGSELLVSLHQGLAFHQLDAQRSNQVSVTPDRERHAEPKQQAKQDQHRQAKFGQGTIRMGQNLVTRFEVGAGQRLTQVDKAAHRREQAAKLHQRGRLLAWRLCTGLESAIDAEYRNSLRMKPRPKHTRPRSRL